MNLCMTWKIFSKIKLSSYIQEKERYKEPVRESLKALLAIGWTVEHSDVEVPSNNRNSTRRSSKTSPVSINSFMIRYALLFHLFQCPQNSALVLTLHANIYISTKLTLWQYLNGLSVTDSWHTKCQVFPSSNRPAVVSIENCSLTCLLRPSQYLLRCLMVFQPQHSSHLQRCRIRSHYHKFQCFC